MNGTTFKAASNYNSNPSLKITVNNTTKDITPLLDELLKKYKNTSGDNTLDEISLETDIDKYHVKILFESISWYTNETNYNFDNVTYLLKENK